MSVFLEKLRVDIDDKGSNVWDTYGHIFVCMFAVQLNDALSIQNNVEAIQSQMVQLIL